MSEQEFIEECKKIGIILNEKQVEKFKLYKDLLIEWNKKFNLTRIIEEKDIYLKHFYDSILLSKYCELNNKTICDFGTGAGFPGIVLAIIFNNSSFTLLESNGKKVLFLNEVKNRLNLNNIEIINDRVEKYAKNNREKYDIVTCRAVSNLNIILELSVALLKINSYFVPMKASIEDEINSSRNTENKLGYKLINKYDYLLPIEESKRTILIYKKIKKTDSKYPRNYNLIKKQ